MLSDARYTPDMLRAMAADRGPEYNGNSRNALCWCANVTEAADAAIQEARAIHKQDTALIRQLVEALEGYRRNHNDGQPCDAERAGRARLLDSDLSKLTDRGAKAWAGVDAQKLREGGV